MFRLSKHEIHTIEINKVALNRDDNKRISKKDRISTFARGHKDLSWSPILGELSLIWDAKPLTLHDRILISLLELSSSKVPSGGLLYNRILGRHT